MKLFTFRTAFVSTALFASMAASAQSAYIKEAPAGGFDFKSTKDFVVLYAPNAAVQGMAGKIVSDQNLDPDMKKNQFYYWTHDWATTELQLCNVEEPNGKNSYGESDYLNMTPLDTWGGGGFAAKGQAYDLSKVTDDMILHIGLRDFGEEAAGKTKYLFRVGPLAKIASNGFQLEVNQPAGTADGDYVGVGNVGHDKKWYYLDIPVRDLIDEDGNFGFVYDFSQPVNDHIFTITFKDATASTATNVLEPGADVRTYTITKLNTALSLDGIWFYKKESNGITNVDKNTDETVEAIYDLNGRQMANNNLQRGIYLVKTANGVRKVTVK
ncbi:MAG: T9SS type A sorting domain-containing protein [Prevotella sp.]|nr:T9SS type A sorting domain-containing protein [Prevotella sp.]